MKQWYLFFSTSEASEKLPQLGAELQNAEIQSLIKLPQVGAELNEDSLPMILGLVPWRHQTDIVTGCESLDEAIFYLKRMRNKRMEPSNVGKFNEGQII